MNLSYVNDHLTPSLLSVIQNLADRLTLTTINTHNSIVLSFQTIKLKTSDETGDKFSLFYFRGHLPPFQALTPLVHPPKPHQETVS